MQSVRVSLDAAPEKVGREQQEQRQQVGPVRQPSGGRRSERLAAMGRAQREAQEGGRVRSGDAVGESCGRVAVVCYRALLAEVYVAIMDGPRGDGGGTSAAQSEVASGGMGGGGGKEDD